MPMNNLYRAVEIMGRSVEDVTAWGWICGSLGIESKGPKCVNGVVSMAAGSGVPCYLYEHLFSHQEDEEALRLVALALIETAPTEILAAIIAEVEKDGENEVHWRNKGRDANITLLGQMLVGINDHHVKTGEVDVVGDDIYDPYFNKETALAWFTRAFDLLCEELPEPLPMLTVEQIVSAPKLVETRSEMLGIPDDVIVG